MTHRVLTVAILGLAAGARADVLFDSISNYSPVANQQFLAVPEHAEQTNLNTAAGMSIDSVELLCRLTSESQLTEFSGNLVMRLRVNRVAGTNQFPHTIFYEATQHVVIPRAVDTLVAFSVPHVTAPASNIWTSWYFQHDNGQVTYYNDVWVRQTAAAPATGAFWTFAAGTEDYNFSSPIWGYENQHYAIRINTVPGPGAWVVLAAGGVFVHRRRR